jgi:hypothetical protein
VLTLDKDERSASSSGHFILRGRDSGTPTGPKGGLIVVAKRNIPVEFEVFTVAVIKDSVFWGITRCSPVKVNRHF